MKNATKILIFAMLTSLVFGAGWMNIFLGTYLTTSTIDDYIRIPAWDETNGNRVELEYGVLYDKIFEDIQADTIVTDTAYIANLEVDSLEVNYIDSIKSHYIETNYLTITNTINEISIDTTLSGNSDLAVPTEHAVYDFIVDQQTYGEFYIVENTDATVIRGTNEWQALTNYVVQGATNGFTYDAGSTGEIASIADAGSGNVTITDVAHGLTAGDIITINGCTDPAYNGLFEVLTVPTEDTFTITAVYTATDVGYWQQGASLTCSAGAAGIYKGSWSSCGISATNAHVFDFAPCNNTTVGLKSRARRKFSNADYGSFSGCGLRVFAEGDKVFFVVRNITATGNITIRTLDLNFIRIK